jgi:hypothetical protein
VLLHQELFVEQPVPGGATSPVCVVAPNKLYNGEVPIDKGIAPQTLSPGKFTNTG